MQRLLVLFTVLLQSSSNYAKQVPSPPPIMLLDSYIPASMQVIAHITELMKYELKPDSVTTTTTVRPTKPHRPGLYAPETAPGPEAYFAKSGSYEDYVDRLRRPSGYNYFDRYSFPVDGRSIDENNFLTRNLNDLIQIVNSIEEVPQVEDEELQVENFLKLYDDSELRTKKKTPPTRAYVALLSLYDLLNKEAKKLGLNKFNGYSHQVLVQLSETSTGTSSDQLKAVLGQIVQRKDTKNPQVLKKINDLLKDLEESSSYLNYALRYIPPLPFVL